MYILVVGFRLPQKLFDVFDIESLSLQTKRPHLIEFFPG